MKLGEILISERLIAREQLEKILEIQKGDSRKLGELLVAEGLIDDHTLSRALSRILQLPFVKLPEIKIDKEVLKLIPLDLIEKHKVIPYALNDITLKVATSDPLNVGALQEIQYQSGYLVEPSIAGSADIEDHLQKYADELQANQAIQAAKNKGTQDNPVIQLVDSIISRAIKENVSDIHLEPQKQQLRIRYRIDGELYERPAVPNEMARNVISRIKILAGMDVAESRKPQDGRMSYSQGGKEYDIRLSSLPDIQGENLVLRILSKSFSNYEFAELGMDEEDITKMKRLLNRPYGLILVTGPTGAGKTTTLYSMLQKLNKVSKNIISVEDPVEYELQGVTQTASNNYIGYTFATAIRHILRHDPDIIMVGEIRDVETAEMAIRAALTGHLVLSTIHTNSATGAITRLLEMDIEPFLISSAINGVIAQRLVRKVCPHCHEEFPADPQILGNLEESSPAQKITLVQARGCEKCLNSGHQGRIGIYEILEIDKELRQLILKSETEDEISKYALAKGMKNLRSAGIAKALNKITTIEEVLRITAIE